MMVMLVVVATGVRRGECWQCTNTIVPSLHHVSAAWGRRSPGYRNRPEILLYSTAAPSSKVSETLPGDDDSYRDDQTSDNTHMTSNDKMSTSADATTESTADAPSDKGEASEEKDGSAETTNPLSFPELTKQTPVMDRDRLSMPWSEMQDWALRDNLPKYTIMIPLKTTQTVRHQDDKYDDDTNDNSGDIVVFALWRTMLNDVPELAGYPIEFLQRIHSQQVLVSSPNNNESKLIVTPRLLPYLDDYTFASAGGISGNVYGVPGLAEGTRIETTAVTNIEVTLPLGFIRTSDGKAAYELGRPQQRMGDAFDTGTDQKGLDSHFLAAKTVVAKAGSYNLLQTVQSTASDTIEDADGLLVRLGATTGILLAGATAINLLSHHLTVNVFWV